MDFYRNRAARGRRSVSHYYERVACIYGFETPRFPSKTDVKCARYSKKREKKREKREKVQSIQRVKSYSPLGKLGVMEACAGGVNSTANKSGARATQFGEVRKCGPVCVADTYLLYSPPEVSLTLQAGLKCMRCGEIWRDMVRSRQKAQENTKKCMKCVRDERLRVQKWNFRSGPFPRATAPGVK